jgi:hypothetical protein
MWKIVVVLLLTALAILLARLVYDAPVIQTRVGALVSYTQGGVGVPLAPVLMYAGVRG